MLCLEYIEIDSPGCNIITVRGCCCDCCSSGIVCDVGSIGATGGTGADDGGGNISPVMGITGRPGAFSQKYSEPALWHSKRITPNTKKYTLRLNIFANINKFEFY